jgi:hypothetical protein
LEEAKEIIKTMPMEADAMVWGMCSLLVEFTEIFRQGKEQLQSFLSWIPVTVLYVLLANMYREAGMWEEAQSGLSEGA